LSPSGSPAGLASSPSSPAARAGSRGRRRCRCCCERGERRTSDGDDDDKEEGLDLPFAWHLRAAFDGDEDDAAATVIATATRECSARAGIAERRGKAKKKKRA